MKLTDLMEDKHPKYSHEFKSWFSGSKVVTPSGNAKMVYRGEGVVYDSLQDVAWFTDNIRLAKMYTGWKGEGRVHRAYLRMRKPLDLRGKLNTGESTYVTCGEITHALGIELDDLSVAERDTDWFNGREYETEVFVDSDWLRKYGIVRGYDGIIVSEGTYMTYKTFSKDQVWVHSTTPHHS